MKKIDSDLYVISGFTIILFLGLVLGLARAMQENPQGVLAGFCIFVAVSLFIYFVRAVAHDINRFTEWLDRDRKRD